VMIGVAASAVSISSLGLSRTFSGLVFRFVRWFFIAYSPVVIKTLISSRCLLGLFDSSGEYLLCLEILHFIGVTGVIASLTGEVTDSTNRASGFTFSLVSGSVGGSIGWETCHLSIYHRQVDGQFPGP